MPMLPSSSGSPRRRRAALVALAAALCWAAPARAQLSELGLAANYAGLEVGSSLFSISKDTTVVNGNAGVDGNGSLSFTGGGVINGEIDAGSGASLTITGGSTATGGVMQSYASMSQVVQDAQNAAAYYAALTPGQTLSSLGTGTLTGSGGLDVYQINGDLSLSRSNLTLSGGANDFFVINITGAINLSGGSNILLNGISPDQVVFNLIGTGTKMTTTGESDTNGIFLAENGAINISGGVHDSEFIAGGALTWQSGVQVTQAAAALVPVPELAPWQIASLALALVAGFEFIHRRRVSA